MGACLSHRKHFSRALSNPSFPGLDALFVLRSTKLRKQVTSLAQPLPRLRLMLATFACRLAYAGEDV